ncbi:methylmalonyl-CoA epimerase [Alteribacillus sp. HJP-4]|uniref:methylmalonyl-CoA epimerase n=1 Tax=Alteribacillus sp. HJP-4 TaxID=2775394 RepID=UPI0035CCFFCA
MNNPPERIDHIGIAVRSIKDQLPFYLDHLHLELAGMEEVKEQGVKVAFIKIGNSKIELLEPLGNEGPLHTFLEKKGEGIHHVALGVTNINERLKELRDSGIRTLQDKSSRGAGGAEVAFLHPASAGKVLYELCEPKKQEDLYDK